MIMVIIPIYCVSGRWIITPSRTCPRSITWVALANETIGVVRSRQLAGRKTTRCVSRSRSIIIWLHNSSNFGLQRSFYLFIPFLFCALIFLPAMQIRKYCLVRIIIIRNNLFLRRVAFRYLKMVLMNYIRIKRANSNTVVMF